ncbi:class I SAM-dependent DNA methyltransferase [Siccirubricoccus deserti]
MARGLRVLDLGCGTGLSGVALAPFAARLEGLDLSPRMLAEAGRRGLYQALHQADLLSFLPAHPAAYGLVAAVDVLIPGRPRTCPARHGDGAGTGRGGGILSGGGEGVPFALGEGMRYRHDPAHVAQLAATAGLAVAAQRGAVLRQEKGRRWRGRCSSSAPPVERVHTIGMSLPLMPGARTGAAPSGA